ncbi:Proton-coupled folate transporter [Nymphon striatum]|nr:Proton-coupled folate transporter [Nymphon striatum]
METKKKGVKLNLSSLKVLKNITVEPVIALYLFSYNLVGTFSVTLLMERICTLQKEQPEHVCKDIFDNDAYAQLRIESQKVANDYLLANQFIFTIPGIFLAMLTGPWSEKYGRRAPIIIPLIGDVIRSVLLTMMAHFKELPPYFFLCATILNGIMGGFIHMMTLFSYVADYVFIYGVCYLANPLGKWMGGFIYHKYGLVPAYIIASTSSFCALLYSIFFLKETRGLECKLTVREYIREFFRLKNVKECFGVNDKKETVKRTKKTISFAYLQKSTFFMYSQVLLDWSNYTYLKFQSAVNLASMINVALTGPILSGVLGISDYFLGMTGAISAIGSLIIMSLSTKPWMFYVGGFTGLFSVMTAPICRSLMTKIVRPDEISLLFAFVSSVEAFTPALAAVVETQIYNATVTFFPSCHVFTYRLDFCVCSSEFSWYPGGILPTELLGRSDKTRHNHLRSMSGANVDDMMYLKILSMKRTISPPDINDGDGDGDGDGTIISKL